MIISEKLIKNLLIKPVKIHTHNQAEGKKGYHKGTLGQSYMNYYYYMGRVDCK